MTKKGKDNHNWKGGITIDKDGYILVKKYGHPFAHNDYVREHRLVYEHYLSIVLNEEVIIPREMVIHHINENREDNRICNLELVTKAEHNRIHDKNRYLEKGRLKKDMSNRFCSKCGSKDTSIRNGTPVWARDGSGGWLCRKCSRKIKGENHKSSQNHRPDVSKYKCDNCGSKDTYINRKTRRPLWRHIEGKILCSKCTWLFQKYPNGIKPDKPDHICLHCNSNTTEYDKDGYARWYKFENGFLCVKCYRKERRRKP